MHAIVLFVIVFLSSTDRLNALLIAKNIIPKQLSILYSSNDLTTAVIYIVIILFLLHQIQYQ